MSEKRLIKISKYLSYHLRHNPGAIALQLAPGGWVSVDELLTAAKKHQFPLSREELTYVVQNNDKKRFSFDETGTLIRANQGHSVDIDLQLEPKMPPDILYHGTGHRSIEMIMTQGLRKMSRHHVHLSSDIETAKTVGKRHGKPVVFAIDSARMHAEGYPFYCSENLVWLVEEVPPDYLKKV